MAGCTYRVVEKWHRQGDADDHHESREQDEGIVRVVLGVGDEELRLDLVCGCWKRVRLVSTVVLK